MNVNAASAATAMRCPGGGKAGRWLGEATVSGAAPATIRSRSRWRCAILARRSRPIGKAIEPSRMIGVLLRLYKPQMTFRDGQRRIARHRAKDRDVERIDRVLDEHTMPFAADVIEYNARDAHVGIMGREPAHHCGGGLRLAGDIED